MNRPLGSRKMRPKLWPYAISFLVFVILSHTQVNAAPASEKLRIFVQPISGSPPREAWKSSEEKFIRQQYKQMERILTQKGIYEVVPEDEVRTALKGKTVPDWKWKSGDWSLAKEIGRAVGADYVMVMERGFQGFLYWRMTLINLTTGRQFEDQDHIGFRGQDPGKYRELQRESYRRIFMAAKGDMLTTAMRKGRIPGPAGEPDGQPLQSQTGAVTPQAPAVTAKPSQPPARRTGEGAKTTKPALQQEKGVVDRPKMIVYDFDAAADLHVAGLILAEALREELHQIGRFVLVNREDIVKVLEEHKLKQSGLLGEDGATEIGKWLTAREIVTGKLSRLGSASILQAKRTDVETMNTRAIGSLKCEAGKEEDLINGMPGLARRLADAQ